MSKEMYLEMCQQLGSTPKGEEMPITLDDLTAQSQTAIEVFNYLPDKWSAMGSYEGKDLSNFTTIFELFEIPKTQWILYLDLLGVLIENQVAIVNKKIQAEAKKGAKRGR